MSPNRTSDPSPEMQHVGDLDGESGLEADGRRRSKMTSFKNNGQNASSYGLTVGFHVSQSGLNTRFFSNSWSIIHLCAPIHCSQSSRDYEQPSEIEMKTRRSTPMRWLQAERRLLWFEVTPGARKPGRNLSGAFVPRVPNYLQPRGTALFPGWRQLPRQCQE